LRADWNAGSGKECRCLSKNVGAQRRAGADNECGLEVVKKRVR
jgi:hypothetical protein